MNIRRKIFSPELPGQIKLVWTLSIPAILSQISSIIMEYIDSAMVGHLGANASASIGLVVATTWVFGGLCTGFCTGFSVQVAHNVGAGRNDEARRVVKHGLVCAIFFAALLMALGMGISRSLPRWLGGAEELWEDATKYFFVFAVNIPFMLLCKLASAYLQCSGNMVVPSVLNSVGCLLDAGFNALFIPKLGVLGASLGTLAATVIASTALLWYCLCRSKTLKLDPSDEKRFDAQIVKKAVKMGFPVAVEQIALSGALVVTTGIIAPLGTVSIAAHSFAVTAESICYMPGFGVASAATTLVGQRIGAGDAKLAKRYGTICTFCGCAIMTGLAVIMYFLCPLVFRLLTPDESVRALAVTVLRIEMFAEPLYSISMVATGALRGAADTLVPSIINLFSTWVIRLGLSLLLVGPLALRGIWIAMAGELCLRGVMIFWRHCTSRSYESSAAANQHGTAG